MFISLFLLFFFSLRLKVLQAWPIDCRHNFHIPSNSGFEHLVLKAFPKNIFKFCKDSAGNGGCSLHPWTVHSFITSSPMKLSLANFIAKVGILDRLFNCLYFWYTMFAGNNDCLLLESGGDSVLIIFIGSLRTGVIGKSELLTNKCSYYTTYVNLIYLLLSHSASWLVLDRTNFIWSSSMSSLFLISIEQMD